MKWSVEEMLRIVKVECERDKIVVSAVNAAEGDCVEIRKKRIGDTL